MNIEHIKLFTRVASLGNISQAGKELNLSPAVSSAHINKLEEDLGVRLIHRTTRKVSLTEEGEAFLPHAQSILEDIDAARAAVGSGDIDPKGKLRVTAPASFGRMHILPLLEEFLATYPQLDIDMHLSDAQVNLVEGGFDVAIRNAEMNDSSLIARKLASDKRVLCASSKYIDKNGLPKNPEDLQNHECVNLMGLESWSLSTPNGLTVIKTKNRFRTDNGEAARDGAVQGLGVTLCSTWCCYQELKSGKLIQVLQDYPVASNTAIWAVYPSTRLLAPKVRVFIDFLIKKYSGVPYWDSNL